jgi:hypothetical protein
MEGFRVAPSGEGRTNLLFPGRQGVESPPSSIMTIPWLENPLIDQAMMTIPPRQEMPLLDDNPPPPSLKRRRTCWLAAQ